MTKDCVDPGSVAPEDVLAFATGEAEPRVAAHVQACAACAELAAAYQSTDAALRSRLFRVDCPPAQVLGELALDVLPPQEALAARAHLALCPHCAGELAALRAELEGDPMQDLAPRPNLLTRIVARLRPAPGPAVALAGVRGGGSPAFIYEAGALTLSLTVEPEGSGPRRRWSLLCLVVDESGGEVPAGVPARLLRRGEAIQEVGLDEWGNLAFTGLEAGTYDLELALGDRVVAIEGIAVGDQG